MKKIEAKIIADSISPQGNRIISYLLTYPRFIHSELMTHRMFSRNSASSRAIPFEKMVKMVEEDPFIPIAWQKHHLGMQGTEYWIDDDTVTVDEGDEYERYTKIYSATKHFITEWLEARDLAIAQSYELNRLGVTKQLCNRLLEPFMWHTVLVTATSYENFFELRCPQYQLPLEIVKSKKEAIKLYPNIYSNFTELDWLKINQSQAEIHIQALAESMWDVYNESTPKELKAGEWHIPFGDNILNLLPEHIWKHAVNDDGKIIDTPLINAHVKISTARCARLSYMTFDGEIDYEKDIELHDKLLQSGHYSPFEHCARAMSDEEYDYLYKSVGPNPEHFETGWCNNFRGFIQYRYLIENNEK